MLPALTPRQKTIYEFVLKTIREKGYALAVTGRVDEGTPNDATL